MNSQDKKEAAESTNNKTVPTPLQSTKVEDQPPPYSSCEPSSVPKPPQLPSEPPALTREPLPARRPQNFDSRRRQVIDYARYSAWEDCKAFCCSTKCWAWSK